MRRASLGSIVSSLSDATTHGDPATEIVDINYSSGQVKPGALFAALRGSKHDGHAFVPEAVERGAAALLAEETLNVPIPQVIVPNSRQALARISAEFYGHPSHELSIIGITGTDGKTTTTALLQSILRHAGFQTGTIGTVGIDIGNGTRIDLGHQTTPESNLVQRYLRTMVDAGTTHVVVEATSHGLATYRLDGVRFVAGGVTNITHEHLEFHKTVENYRRAKAKLLEHTAQASGVVALNIDDEGATAITPYAHGASIVTYGCQAGAKLQAENIDTEGSGICFDVVDSNNGERVRVELPMPGRFNVSNALCAIALAGGVGVPQDLAARALGSAAPVRGRMQAVDAGQPFRVIVDYAHTPESIRLILRTLREQHPDTRLIVVTGSAGDRDTAKRPLQGAACAEIADVTVVTSEDPRSEDPKAINEAIIQGALTAGAVRDESVVSIVDRRAALRYAFDIARPGDCVLLAGKGHETSIIWADEYEQPWDEAAVARELLRELTVQSQVLDADSTPVQE